MGRDSALTLRAKPLRKVLIDASNLWGGGGLQVASSFLDELADLRQDPEIVARFPWLSDGELAVEASEAVVENLTCDLRNLPLTALGRRGATLSGLKKPRVQYEVIFVVFGPDYVRRRARQQICGFADVTSLWPAASRLSSRGLRSAVHGLLRRSVSRHVFRRRDRIVVEAEHVKQALVTGWRVDPHRVSVVPNTPNRVFFEEGFRPGVSIPDTGESLRICYVTRSYPHKNLAFLGPVGEGLNRRGIDAKFVLTLNDDEWEAIPPRTRHVSVNVGPLDSAHLPSLYQQCDASIFPSLFECFSVTPLEALACGVPLAASDRPFVREVCKDSAAYFDPQNPEEASKCIAELWIDEDRRMRQVASGKELVSNWPDARDRALAYIAIIDRTLATAKKGVAR